MSDQPEPEIRVSKPLPVEPGKGARGAGGPPEGSADGARSASPRGIKKAGPSLALSAIFALGMTAIVVPLVGFVVSVSIGWQGGLNVFTAMLKWSFIAIGCLLAYGMLVGIYHTFLAMTGLDRGPRR